MGAFKINNPLIVMMIKIANMMIVSFFWLLCCIPVVTIMPASAALYHTTVKVINGNGNGVVRDFFYSLKDSLRRGVILSLIMAAGAVLLLIAHNLGRQMWDRSFLWAFYYAIGFLLMFIWLSITLWLPPVLSRFDAGISVLLRLSVYFASRNLLRMLFMALLFGLTLFLADFYPVLVLILPGLYTDLIHSGVEKTMVKYIEENGLEEEGEESESETSGDIEPMTSMEFDRMYGQSGEDKDK